MTANFPNLGKETDIQIQETQRIPNKMNPKRSTPRHIMIKMSKVKGKRRIFIFKVIHKIKRCNMT